MVRSGEKRFSLPVRKESYGLDIAVLGISRVYVNLTTFRGLLEKAFLFSDLAN